MKKLIAISVMIALIASAAFADTSLSGNVEARVMLFEGHYGDHSTDKGDPYDGSFPKPTIGGSGSGIAASAIKLAGNADDGSMGAALRIRWHYLTRALAPWSQAFIWWKPIDQVRIFVGLDDDGMFETGKMTSWAFHQGSEAYLTQHDWDYWRARFPGNWDTFGIALSFYLVPGLNLNLVAPIANPNGWPRHGSSDNEAQTDIDKILPGSLQLTAEYAIQDVGSISFAYIGNYRANLFAEDKPDGFAFGRIGASFFSGSLVDGLQFQLGFATVLAKGGEQPIDLGASVAYAAGDFGIKWRIGVDIGAANAGDANASVYTADTMFITTNIMPSYNIAGIGKLCLDIGVSFAKLAPEKDTDPDSAMGFWVNPYLKAGLSGGYFQVGIIVKNNISGTGHSVIAEGKSGYGQPAFYLPMLMGFNF